MRDLSPQPRTFSMRMVSLAVAGMLIIGCTGRWYRHYGITSERQLTQPESVPFLINALSDQRANVRLRAVQVLVRIGEPARPASPELAFMVNKDAHPKVRLEAIRALGTLRVDGQREVGALIKALSNPNPRIKAAAADAIKKIDPQHNPTPAALKLLLSNRDLAVRLYAAKTSYRRLPEQRAASLKVILALLRNRDPVIRQKSLQTLRELECTDDAVFFELGGIAASDRSRRIRAQATDLRNHLTAAKRRKAAGGQPVAVTPDPITKPPLLNPPDKPKIHQRIAVVIGISTYQHDGKWKLANLRYASKDAKALATHLKAADGGRFDTVIELMDKDATTKNVKIALREKMRAIQEKDLVMVFWAGHGSPDPAEPKQLYLITHDTDPAHLAATGYSMDEFSKDIAKIRSRRVIVVADACHSGGISDPKVGIRGPGKNKIVTGIRGMAVVPDEDKDKAPMRMIFTSSEAGEVSRESADLGGGHGVFSWYFLRALKGDADADRVSGNNDRIITLGEIIEFTRDRVKRFTGNQQHPDTAGTFDRSLPLGKR